MVFLLASNGNSVECKQVQSMTRKAADVDVWKPRFISMPTITMYCRYILVSRSEKKMHRRINKEINLDCCMCSIISVVSITFNSLSVCLSSLCFTAKSVPPSHPFAYRRVSSNSAFRLWPMHLTDVSIYVQKPYIHQFHFNVNYVYSVSVFNNNGHISHALNSVVSLA